MEGGSSGIPGASGCVVVASWVENGANPLKYTARNSPSVFPQAFHKPEGSAHLCTIGVEADSSLFWS